MLKLSLLPDEYLTISDNIVVQLTRVAGGRAYLAIEAAREIPVVRGKVLEREGVPRPRCLSAKPRRRSRGQRDLLFRWNDDRERAVKAMERVMEHLERQGAAEEVKFLRRQLGHIVPDVWEDEIAAQ